MVNDSLITKSENLYLGILPAGTRRAFLTLAKASWLNKGGWYLAGGTALALQCGHRSSLDLDFFTRKKDFDQRELEANLLNVGRWQTDSRSEGTLYGTLLKAKISFIAYPFFHPSRKKIDFGNIKMLSTDDIAVMKIIAISQRGRKRDFIDLYWYCNNAGDLKETLFRVLKQYPQEHNLVHIFRSLTYFDEAEKDAMPQIQFLATWSQIKSYFRSQVAFIAREFLGLK